MKKTSFDQRAINLTHSVQLVHELRILQCGKKSITKNVFFSCDENELHSGFWPFLFCNVSIIPGLNNSIGPIARNCPKLPEMTVGQPHLSAEIARKTCIMKIRATNVFLRQTAAHCTSYALWILRGVLQSECHLVLNQLLFVVAMISSPLYLVWLYDQLSIEPWYESSMI